MPRSGGDPVSDALRTESRRLALECVRLRAGLREALEIYDRRRVIEDCEIDYSDETPALDAKVDELRKLLGGES